MKISFFYTPQFIVLPKQFQDSFKYFIILSYVLKNYYISTETRRHFLLILRVGIQGLTDSD